MANESTNDWTIKNYREVPYWETPFAVMTDTTEIPESITNLVTLDLYKGSTLKVKVKYLVANDLTPEDAEIKKWDEVSKAKSEYLTEKY